MTRVTVLVFLLAASLAGAARLCVWEYDSLDRFFDPVRGESVSCVTSVAADLAALGHSVDVFSQLPTDISPYDAVFCLMGWYRC